ncbi:MAG: hypothetical protein Q4B67_01680 [Eubacteriales bacterium]|nr:hypothetical protein [Eubacteriales bacterium]
MPRKSLLGSLLSVGALVGAAAVVGKYMKEYTDYKAADDEDFDDIRESSGKVKEAVSRTYVALKESGDVKAAAGQLKDAVFDVATDAGEVATKIGKNTADFIKSEKEKYDGDKEGYVEGFKDNVKNYGEALSSAAKAFTENFSETFNDDRLRNIKDQAMERYENATKDKENDKE